MSRRAIKEGEIIIDNEEPLVVGPKQATFAVDVITFDFKSNLRGKN